MNTGTQRSSATPMGALTTTTPVLTKQQHKKDFLKIMEAHRITSLAVVEQKRVLGLIHLHDLWRTEMI